MGNTSLFSCSSENEALINKYNFFSFSSSIVHIITTIKQKYVTNKINYRQNHHVGFIISLI